MPAGARARHACTRISLQLSPMSSEQRTAQPRPLAAYPSSYNSPEAMVKVQTIALAGVGSLGRYLFEEISKDSRYSVIVLSRQDLVNGVDTRQIRVTDYTEASVRSILDASRASTLISTIQCADETYVPLHTGLLNACLLSATCKRFIPSEFAGNVEAFPHLPRAYSVTRTPFRETLRQARGVEWTSFNMGWFMDYFVPQDKTLIRHVPGEFPIDLASWRYTVRGTGEELQSFTCARDVAKAIAELLQAPIWDEVTYVAGEFASFNKAARILEEFYGRPLHRSFRSEADIQASLEKHANHGGCNGRAIAEAEELTISGACCCPPEKTLRQRSQFFGAVHFVDLRTLLQKTESSDM
ncbi:NAD(P)-binding protein [Aspergillus recurvatus]